MNCDQVFDILTRGPFPTGTPCDTGVEAHLNNCSECRRLAEALRPALELFQEAVGPEESRDLPGYWCAVATDRAQPAVSYAKNTAASRPTRRGWSQTPVVKNFSALAVWRLAAALLVGVTVGSVLSVRGTFDGFSALPPGIAGAAGFRSDDDDQPKLSTSEHKQLAVLPAACFRNRPGSALRYSVTMPRVLEQADLANLNCCTECHNANSDAISSNATLAVSQSCQICHKE
jgi:hypothetical protein